MTKFPSRMDGAESLGPTGGITPAQPAPKASVPFEGAAEEATIPDYPGAEKGLNGVKAPYSYRQEDDIRDRLIGAGVIKHDKI